MRTFGGSQILGTLVPPKLVALARSGEGVDATDMASEPPFLIDDAIGIAGEAQCRRRTD